MKTSYDYYVLGCRDAGIAPVSAWRFNLAYAKYRRHVGREFEDILAHDVKKRQRILARWQRLHALAELVRRGQDIADRARHPSGDEDEPGTAGAGMREPAPPRARAGRLRGPPAAVRRRLEGLAPVAGLTVYAKFPLPIAPRRVVQWRRRPF